MENEISLTNVELTPQQESAADAIKAWFLGPKTGSHQTFTLAGYAGTGKTYLIDYVIQYVLNLKPYEVAFAAPTGKAAMVLVQKGRDAHTIHRLIYHEEESQYVTITAGKPVIHTSMHFTKIRSLPSEYKLIVIDEVSMVSQYMMNDILSFGIPVLCCGDPGQLQPVAADMNRYIAAPNAILSDVVRQAADSPILKLATDTRRGIPLLPGTYGDSLRIVPRWQLGNAEYMKLLTEADQVICGRNATRNSLNDQIRQNLGFGSGDPKPGEKIICCANDYSVPVDANKDFFLINGCIGKLMGFTVIDEQKSLCKISFKPDFLDNQTDGILTDMGAFRSHAFAYDVAQKAYLMQNGTYEIAAPYQKRIPGESHNAYAQRVKTEILNRKRAMAISQINEFDYGYAISCHKSQGSEFDNLVVIDESNSFKNEKNRWLYTAITRAKKTLTIILP